MGDESTPDRILSTALRMFNGNGVDRVPIYKIASSLNISPGNLTYHFTKKQDIIYALVDRLEQDVADVLSSSHNHSVKHIAKYIVDLFSVMWRYYFFLGSLSNFTATDPHLAESYQRIMTAAIKGSIQRIEDAISCGDIAPLASPNSLEILGRNMWAVWVNRLGSATSGNNEHSNGLDAIYDCCIHHLSLIQPYASETYILQLHNAFKELLEIDAQPTKIG